MRIVRRKVDLDRAISGDRRAGVVPKLRPGQPRVRENETSWLRQLAVVREYDDDGVHARHGEKRAEDETLNNVVGAVEVVV